MHSLPIFLSLMNKPVILIGEGQAVDAKRRLLERVGAQVVDEAAEASFAIVALNDVDEATEAVERLRRRGILVNATDRPELCDFTLPAIVDRGDVLIAIGTGGTSAGLAAALRQRLEGLLPASLGRLATAMFAGRARIRQRWPDAAERRRAIGAAFAAGGPLNVLAEHADTAFDDWLGARQATEAEDALIELASDDPDDLTLRQARWLSQADVIIHAPDIPDAILDRARADAQRVATDMAPTSLRGGSTVRIVRRH